MPKPNTHLQTEAATLGRGAEAMLRRILRFLVGRISLVRLHELIEQLYVEELEDKLRAEDPNHAVTLSLLALNTGLDTRHIHRIRNNPSYRRSLVEEAGFLRDLTPAASFLHIWATDRRFLDMASRKPKALPFNKRGSGADLVARTLQLPRGITLTSVIAQLEVSGMIDVDRDLGLITMRTDRFLPEPDRDQLGAMEVGFAAICRLIDTVLSNLDTDRSGTDRLYQRVYWINRMAPDLLPQLREALKAVLDQAEQESCRTLARFDPGYDLPDQVSAGFGVYLFEDDRRR